MKKTVAVTLAVGAVLAPAATAAKGPKPDQPAKTAHAVVCKAPRATVLFGTFVAAGDGSFTMDVTKANANARKLVGKKAYSVKVDAKTKFVRGGAAATLASLVAGDRLNVQASLCKASDVETAVLLARRVVAKPAPATTGESGS